MTVHNGVGIFEGTGGARPYMVQRHGLTTVRFYGRGGLFPVMFTGPGLTQPGINLISAGSGVITLNRSQIAEMQDIIDQVYPRLLAFNKDPALANEVARARQTILDVREKLVDYINESILAERLLDCFSQAYEAGITMPANEHVLDMLFARTPHIGGPLLIVQFSIVFALGLEGKLLTKVTFTNREQVEQMLDRMDALFDKAKEMAADQMDSGSYTNILNLAAKISRYLAATALPLPQIIPYRVNKTRPALVLANYFYADASRWKEIVEMNSVVHPLFCKREGIILSSDELNRATPLVVPESLR
jgi:hypothetical protein